MNSPIDRPDPNSDRVGPPLAPSAPVADIRPPFIYIILLAMFVAGTVSLVLGELGDDPPRAFYRLLGLFSHDSDWVFAKETASHSRTIRWLAVLAPIVSTLALASLFFNWAWPLWLRLQTRARLMFGHKNCIALVGLSQQSLDLAVSLRTAPHGDIVPIIMADDADPSLAKECAKQGVAVFGRHAWRFGAIPFVRPGRPVTPRTSHVLNQAWGVVSFLPTADAQLEFINELRFWWPIDLEARSRVWILRAAKLPAANLG